MYMLVYFKLTIYGINFLFEFLLVSAVAKVEASRETNIFGHDVTMRDIQ